MSQNKIYLQVISSSPADSAIIQQCGGNRVQLVSALQIGGVTPCSTIIRRSLQAVSIPTNIIVRHHNNGFVYSHKEKTLLLQDIMEIRDRYQANGVVVGAIQINGDKVTVDEEFMKEVVKECGGKMKVTFHKASDYTNNLCETAKILEKIGVDQILTQGSRQDIISMKSIQAIKQIQEGLKCKMILPGGGINFVNAKQIIKQWKVSRLHIGTCVRKDKYGEVSKQLLNSFIKLVS